ncbi:MAG: hypothetical protein IPJ68_01345 [Candidatus Moraniibacteriota bacterium]|nr:MAG: hypothetical protein IPJ68_01345 [Candidatus Moranbacteria bacterium]
MDILSHGLYGGVAFGRRSRISYWLAFFFGIAPDLFSFGLFFALTILGLAEHPDWRSGQHPDPAGIPGYVHALYNGTHSLVIFVAVFALVWLIRKKPLYEMFGWPLHILVDIPTHSEKFFPTPFLWPVSDFHVNGHNWSDPRIFIPNVIFLIGLYLWFYVIRPRRVRQAQTVEEKVHQSVASE